MTSNSQRSTTSCRTKYIDELCRSCSKGKVELRSSPVGGLGGFATSDLSRDEVIFAIPRHLILSPYSPQVLDHSQGSLICELLSNQKILPETVFFFYMALHRVKNPYLRSLFGDKHEQDSLELLDADELVGTNVGAQICEDRLHLQDQYKEVEKHLSKLPQTFEIPSFEELVHARIIYNSRRYPLRFAYNSYDDSDSKGNGLKNDRANPPTKRQRRNIEDQGSNSSLSTYDSSHGCLVPLLDILNHKDNTKALRFEVTRKDLLVICNDDCVQSGQEIFSNYGCTSNDQFLLQFGFVSYAPVSVPKTGLGNRGEGDLDCDDLDVFTVAVGAGKRYDLRRDSPIPIELLADGGYGLEAHLSRKQAAQLTAKVSKNRFIQQYMQGQRKLLDNLLHRIQLQIQRAEEEEIDDEGHHASRS